MSKTKDSKGEKNKEDEQIKTDNVKSAEQEKEETKTPKKETKEPKKEKEKDNEKHSAQLEAKDKEISELKDKLLRNMAEYDNYRKRTAKERMDIEPELTAKITAEFLPVMDNLERAIATECTDDNYKKGVEMIYESFKETLSKLGVTEIPTENEDFNPSFHQAVQQVQSEELESGKIAATFQKGYKIGDKVIRFSMVSVVS